MENISGKSGKVNRILYYDCLRIFAVFAVMVIHASAQNFGKMDVKSVGFLGMNILNSSARWSTPVFVMISGGGILNSEYFTSNMYKKIKRILTAFIFWSIVYAAKTWYYSGTNMIEFISEIITGHYHMWFCYMIIGLYMIVPFLKKIIDSDGMIRYFLGLSLVFTFLLPTIITIMQISNSDFATAIGSVSWSLSFFLTLGYSSYFVCGYYLSKENIFSSHKSSIVVYVMGVIGFISTILITQKLSNGDNTLNVVFYDNFKINIMFESIGVFLLFKNVIAKIVFSKKVEGFIIRLSRDSFGMYLCHAFIMEQLNVWFNINTVTLCNSSFLSIPLLSLIVFIISFLIADILNHIPYLNRIIV